MKASKKIQCLAFRSIAFAVVLSLVNFQIFQSFPVLDLLHKSAFAAEPLVTTDPTNIIVPVKPVTEDVTASTTDDFVEADGQEGQTQEIDFLMDEAALSKAELSETYVVGVYDSAAEGIHELQEGIAVAYLAKTVTADDLRQLRAQKQEVGLLIAGNLVVIYSTGDEEFIRGLEPVRSLVESDIVSLSAHFHKEGGPSEVDLREDVGVQYVISVSENGDETTWVHEGGEVTGRLTYDQFIRRTIEARGESDADQAEVRAELNEYIASIDAYEGGDQEEDFIYEGESTVVAVVAPTLFANHPETFLPLPPNLRVFEAFPENQNNSFAPVASNEVAWAYDVAKSGSWAALNINWDAPVDFAQFEGFLPITLALDEKAGELNDVPVIVELVDASNIKVQFLILKVTTGFQTFSLVLNDPGVPASFDLSQISALNLILAEGGLFGIKESEDRSGVLSLRLNGLPFLSPGGATDITQLPRVLPSVFQGGFDGAAPAVVEANVLSSTFVKISYQGQDEDSFGGAFFNYDNPATDGIAESIDVNTLFPNGIVFQVNFSDAADPLTTITFEIKDADDKVWRVNLLELASFGKKYFLDPEHIFGIDTICVCPQDSAGPKPRRSDHPASAHHPRIL